MTTAITLFTADQIRQASSMKTATTMIRENMRNDDLWLVRGMLAIYAHQTKDEQSQEQTTDHNDVGFNGLDANILSSFSKQVLEWRKTPAQNRRFPVPMSRKQFDIARTKMLKYAGQLARMVRTDAA